MKKGIILQSRVGSTRMPGKSLKILYNKTLTEHIIDRLKTSGAVDCVIIAIPDTDLNKPLARIAIDNEINLFCGPEDDVLKRYFLAASKYELDIIVRVTGDDPLVDVSSMDQMIQQHICGGNHYTNTTALPLGCGSEAFTMKALEQAYRECPNGSYREHVTPYFYKHPDIFKTGKWVGPYTSVQCHTRLTVDTPEDFKLMEIIYKMFWDEDKIIPVDTVLKFLEENPDIANINSHIVQKDADE